LKGVDSFCGTTSALPNISLDAADNTVRVNNLSLQIEKSPYRGSFAKCNVDVYEHLDNIYTVAWKKRILGRYDKKGRLYLQGSAPQRCDQENKRQGERSPRPSADPAGSVPVALHRSQQVSHNNVQQWPRSTSLNAKPKTKHLTCYENRTS